ncbi:MAG: hypothetical protein QMD22_06880 [archaeon]|nr:hypothetical protein [archaeon]
MVVHCIDVYKYLRKAGLVMVEKYELRIFTFLATQVHLARHVKCGSTGSGRRIR